MDCRGFLLIDNYRNPPVDIDIVKNRPKMVTKRKLIHTKMEEKYLQISFGGKGLRANMTLERFIASVGPHVYLQGRAGRKISLA